MESSSSRIKCYRRLIGLSITFGSIINDPQQANGFSSSPSFSLKRKLPTSSSSLNVIEKNRPRFNLFGKTQSSTHVNTESDKKHGIRTDSLRHRVKEPIIQKNVSIEKNDDPFREMMKGRTDFEMALMSTLAVAIPTGIIVTLAMNGESSEGMSQQVNNFFRDIGSLLSIDNPTEDAVTLVTAEGLDLLEDTFEELGEISLNVFDAAIPTSATDVISIALGEGIAAGLGGLVSSLAGIALKTKGVVRDGLSYLENSNSTVLPAEASVDGFIAGAVADTDYFITRAGLSALGVPSFLGVIVAAIPSQLIKLSARQREQREQEDLFMENLLEAEKKRKKNASLFRLKPNPVKEPTIEEIIEQRPTQLDPGLANQVDFVEIFADVTKWLEYDVLIQNFEGMVNWNGQSVSSGLESAVFGFLAALSSQLWADVIYRNFDYGLQSNREASKARSVADTLTLYSLRCLSAATLFGVYESVRLPISKFIVDLLSGGVDSCVGSQDYNLCIETFVFDNPAQATSEGEIRAFFVAAANIFERISDFGSVNPDTLSELIRSLAVQFASVMS